ncbi:MAG: curli assembly protein CsgF [Pseudomonadota bacterium]
MFSFRYTCVAALLFLTAPQANAQEFVHQFKNPSFGGPPFNSSHLLSIAEIDRPDPPTSTTSTFGRQTSQADLFVRQLESRILSRLSSDITDAIFGEDAEPSGEFAFDDTRISFDTLLDGSVIVSIADETTGGVTTIEVPGFLAEPAQ